jgi:hypothetical protein
MLKRDVYFFITSITPAQQTSYSEIFSKARDANGEISVEKLYVLTFCQIFFRFYSKYAVKLSRSHCLNLE